MRIMSAPSPRSRSISAVTFAGMPAKMLMIARGAADGMDCTTSAGTGAIRTM